MPLSLIALLAGLLLTYGGGILLARWWWRYGRFQPRTSLLRWRPRRYRVAALPPMFVGLAPEVASADDLEAMVYGEGKAPEAGLRMRVAAVLVVGTGLALQAAGFVAAASTS